MPEYGGSTGAENTTSNLALPLDTGGRPGDAPNDTHNDKLKDARPPSIWHKYVTIAEEWDRRMMEKWKANMNNLLIFAALFTAIVTAFVIDAMSNIQEDTSTQLLRLLVEQSGQAANMPPPPSSSIVTVGSLWFLSIMCSLAATTWAVLSLEWCAFLTADVRSEDYEETAEKKQRNYEAIHRWRMHIIVASIPFVLHISIFLFLAGLWLRLKDVNRQLELIVGTSTLVIGLSYVIVTLLPTFTSAPFHTSVSEVINASVDEIRYLLKLRHFVRRPPVFAWISNSLTSMFSKCFPRLGPICRRLLYLPLRGAATLLIRLLQWIHRFPSPLAYGMWAVLKKILCAISPVFPPGGDPLKELSRRRTGPSDQNNGVYQRALFRLMNTHLDKSEVKEVLKEWKGLHSPGNVEEHLDRDMVKLLVSSLSSVLWDGKITKRERPIFDHCTMLLAEEMGRVFHDAKYDAEILVWKPAPILSRLRKFVDYKPSSPPPPTPKRTYDDYWDRVIRLLWLSPSKKRIRTVINWLEPQLRSMRPALLQRIVRGLHAATLTSLSTDNKQSIMDFPLPDFSRWDFSDGGLNDDGFNGEDDRSSDDRSSDESSDDGSADSVLNDNGSNNDMTGNDGPDDDDQLAKERLNSELSAFLRNLLTKFYDTATSDDQDLQSPDTIPKLVGALESLKKKKEFPPNFQSALRLFITTTWRSDPSIFDTDPSVAWVLATSADDFIMKTPPNTPDYSKGIAIRLRAIAYGPHVPSESIARLYRGSVKCNPECLSEFIHVVAAVLEGVLAKDGVSDLRSYMNRGAARAAVFPSFFDEGLAFQHSLDNLDCRLPYLYSLAITLSHGIEPAARDHLEALRLLMPLDERPRDAAIEGTLDANTAIEETSDTDAAIEKTLDTNAAIEGTLGTDATINRTLDTNTLVVNIVKQTLSRRTRPALAAVDVQTYLDLITQALQPLQAIIENRGAYPWRTRWKAIYLLADIRDVLPRSLTDFEELQTLIHDTSSVVKSYLGANAPTRRTQSVPPPRSWKTEPAPHDWSAKKSGLKICGLEEAVEKLARRKESSEEVYGTGNVPYLSLYPQRTRHDPTSRFSWLLEKLQRFVHPDIHDPDPATNV